MYSRGKQWKFSRNLTRTPCPARAFDMSEPRDIFVTGASGYMGTRLIPFLLQRGHRVTALVRGGSERKIPPGCEIALADPLDGLSWQNYVRPTHTLVHLIGVAHPSPSKAQQFIDIDQRSAHEAVRVAAGAKVQHFVYVSVAHPAPAMKVYIAVRESCEAAIREAGLNATILRPWYVLGPGHRWPLMLLPFYKLAELIPQTSEGARRLGLVTIDQMIAALASAIENPAQGIRVLEVPEIRSSIL